LKERLPGFPIAVEFRESGWLAPKRRERTLGLLRENGFIYACVDEPQGTRSSVPPLAEVTSPRLSVVRFHGRRGETWDQTGVSTTERFNYFYSEGELAEWVHVLMNNCRGEFAVHNAKDLAFLLSSS
jgi:uncharacterized protein YecE (DUF72 family)